MPVMPVMPVMAIIPVMAVNLEVPVGFKTKPCWKRIVLLGISTMPSSPEV